MSNQHCLQNMPFSRLYCAMFDHRWNRRSGAVLLWKRRRHTIAIEQTMEQPTWSGVMNAIWVPRSRRMLVKRSLTYFFFMLNSFKYGFTMFQCFTIFMECCDYMWFVQVCHIRSFAGYTLQLLPGIEFFLVTMSRVFLSRFHFRTAFNRSSAPCERADHFHRFRCRCSIRLTIRSPRIPKEPLSNNVFY